MATSNGKQQKPNLAALVMVKQKMAAKNDDQPNADGLTTNSKPVIGAHYDEKIHYRPDAPAGGTQAPTTQPSTNTNEEPKASRQQRQIEVKLLDKKMEEIGRKQETTTNEALDTWKAFDSFNYGFSSTPVPVQPVTTKQRSPTPPPKEVTPVKKESAKKSPSPKRQPTPVKQKSAEKTGSPSPDNVRPRTQTPSEQKTPTPPATPQKQDVSARQAPSPPPRNEKPIEKSPSPHPRQNSIPRSPTPPPLPPPRRSKVSSAPSVDAIRSPEPEKPSSVPSKSPVPLVPPIENKPHEPLPIPILNQQRFKLFPEIKHNEISRPKNATRSIQRSMDRYRFHVW